MLEHHLYLSCADIFATQSLGVLLPRCQHEVWEGVSESLLAYATAYGWVQVWTSRERQGTIGWCEQATMILLRKVECDPELLNYSIYLLTSFMC